MFNLRPLGECSPVRQQDIYLPINATPWQCTRVNLIVSGLYISSIFSQESECELVPLSIGPLGADQECNGGVAVRWDGLYVKIHIVGLLQLELIQANSNFRGTR